MIKIKSQINKKDILDNLTDEQIFKHYIPDFTELNKKFRSPFTNEKTPSCSIFYSAGRLFYKCFSSGNGGDCFNFVQTKYNLTEYESLVVIANDFNLGVKDIVFKNTISPNIIIKSRGGETSYKQKARIRVKYKNFSKEGLAYWKQYNITEQDLLYWNIREISYYWINGNRFKVTLGFAYNFSWYEPYTYKILQPYESKEYKWFGNCPDSLLQGYNYLPEKGDLLFITSSYKDVITLYKNGFTSIAPAAEGVLPSQLVIDELKLRFKNVVPYMNNDSPGIKFSLKYQNNLKLNYIINPIGMPKDPSDLVKEGYNVKDIIDFLCKEINL
jgi:DNA primase